LRGNHKLLADPRLAVFLVAAELDVTMLSDASVPDQPEDVREGISRAFSPTPPAITPSGQPNQKMPAAARGGHLFFLRKKQAFDFVASQTAG
jgi:hypothetical protein